jgi:hypothetical protein
MPLKLTGEEMENPSRLKMRENLPTEGPQQQGFHGTTTNTREREQKILKRPEKLEQEEVLPS